MKKHIIKIMFIFCITCFTSCDSDDENNVINNNQEEIECGTHNGNTLFLGPQGGCYYYNSSGNKTYVDRSECAC